MFGRNMNHCCWSIVSFPFSFLRFSKVSTMKKFWLLLSYLFICCVPFPHFLVYWPNWYVANESFRSAIQSHCVQIRRLRPSNTRVVTGFLGIPYAQPPLRNLRFKVNVSFSFVSFRSESRRPWRASHDGWSGGGGGFAPPRRAAMTSLRPWKSIETHYKCFFIFIFFPLSCCCSKGFLFL